MTGIAAVPRIKGGGTKVRFRNALNIGVGKDDLPGLLTPASAAPFDKVGKYGFARRGRGLPSGVVVSVCSVRRQIAVLDGAQFHGLAGGGWTDTHG